jgi:transcriptional regulator of acetoin/glycerol metabolism
MSELRVPRTPSRLPAVAGGPAAAGEAPFALVATRIEPHVLAGLQAVWQGGGALVEDLVALPRSAARRRAAGTPGARLAVFPVFDGDRLAALLYVDGQEIGGSSPGDLQRLVELARGLVRGAPRPDPERPPVPDGWESYLERTPIREIQRRKLSLLLARNEWNISRVARILGVTRRTIYLRLERYQIPRQRVSKAAPRQA